MSMQFTDENFDKEVLKSELPVLVDFYAEWCGPCKMMGPVIDEIATELEGKWKVGKVNVDESPKSAEEYGIQSIPTLVIFKNGEAVERLMGFRGKEDLLEKLS